MIVTVGLLTFAALLGVLAPRAIGSGWSDRAPRLALVVWQAASVGVLVSVVLAGLTLLVPAAAVSEGLAAALDACAATIASAYEVPGRLPTVLVGALLSLGVTLRLGWVAVGSALRTGRERRRLRSAILVGARPEPSLGAVVVDSDRAAAFCLPGRRHTVVLTTAALQALSDDELAGVLAHERAHLRGRHHLILGAARVVSRAFPGLPLFARAVLEIERLVELLADDAAARRVPRVEVASALVTLVGMKAPAAALAAAQGAETRRVTRLLAPGDPVGPLHRVAATAAALLVVAGPMALAAWPLTTSVSSGLCVLPGADWS
ncbi:Peptidase family M48 [Modestobacter sp. DSM 44400]|uniref:M56 family metallopeptidase n=1 Tax=Modestobacter sp. DSM 44400 TaxID=1550230 RepID=UPI00089749D6|nr:M56 family metallopeptidase [Modestobacter sp. DSM 44400]SDY80782.1 Peptidase family M48 [Modestobacter sp. DSM 44400]